MTDLLFQEKISQLKTTINNKNIPSEDKQILLQEVENLKQTLAEHQQRKFKKRDFISYPKNKN